MTTIALRTAAPWRNRTAGASSGRIAAGALAVAAASHAVAGAAHRDSTVAAVLFVATAVVQAGLAIAVLRGPTRSVRLLVAGSTALFIGLWVASRTVGIAIGHAHGPEGVGVVDAAAVAAEAVALLAIAAARRGERRRQLPLAAALSLAVVGTAVFATMRPAVAHHAPPRSTAPHATAGTPTEEPTAAGRAAPAAAPGDDACHDPRCEPHAHP